MAAQVSVMGTQLARFNGLVETFEVDAAYYSAGTMMAEGEGGVGE